MNRIRNGWTGWEKEEAEAAPNRMHRIRDGWTGWEKTKVEVEAASSQDEQDKKWMDRLGKGRG